MPNDPEPTRTAMRVPRPPWTRRRFLTTGAGMGTGLVLAGCAATPSPASPALGNVALPPTRIGAHDSAVTAAETSRATTGRTTTALLQAQVGPIDLGGPTVSTWTYGGALPGPEIRVRAGDRLAARLINGLPQPTSVHWHGIALRNDADGVPGLTQDPVAPGASFDTQFTVPHPGTYMYHPHVGVQLDRGLYGALIVEDPEDPGAYDDELVVLLDDWIDGTGTNPDQQLASLQAQGMGGMAGMSGSTEQSMPGMARSALLGGDAGDVTYPHFLANGRIPAAARTHHVRAGTRLRLRLINIGADTAFRVGLAGTSMTITHTDGFPVTPTPADTVLLGMGERVDALVTVPADPTALIAVAEGKNGTALLRIQSGTRSVPDPGPAGLGPMLIVLPAALRADTAVALPARAPDVTHQLSLAGPTGTYTWTINGETYDPARGLPVHTGQRVRLTITNTSNMYHPMHLHGHTFQIVAAAGPGARKDTVVVLPRQTVQVDLDADNPGQWLAHCHNAYHGEAGMMTVLSYLS
jgi:multicopper oxidase